VYNARNLALPPTVIDNPTPAFQDGFGYHAALLGGDAVIAAMGDDTYGSDAGIVYKFSGTDGSELLKLYSPNTRPNDWFGHALAVSANRIYVAAPGDDSAAADAGAVYWFDGTTGARLGVIPNPRGAAAAGEKFGYQGMAANGNLLAVGCPYADVSGAADAGVVDLFDMDTGSHLTIPNPEPGVGDWFGMSVTFVDGMLLVGAQNDDVGATDAGSAYVFDPSTGALLLTLHNPAPTNGIASGGIGFGGALAAMGNDYVISANGVVYVFEGLPNPITGTTNSDGDYSFPGVAPGNYVLSEVIQPGWRQTKPDGDGKYRISLSSGENLTGLDFGNQHLNTPPVITSISATTPVSEGQATTLTVVFTDPDAGQRHEATIDWGDGQVEPVPIEPDVYAFERSHLYSDNRPSDAPYPITVTVADDLSRSDPGYVFVEVDNVAPTATFSNDGPVAEGSPANVAFADQFDPSPVDTERGFHYSIVLDPAQLAETYDDATDGPSKAFTFADNGAYTVYGRIFDKDDGYQDHETVVTVDNVDPVLTSIESSASAGGGVAEGEPIVVSGTFTDVGTLDVHTARVDWGDGSSSDAQIVESNGSDGLQASHAYAGGGVYTIAVTLKDDDTGTDAKTTLAVVSGSGVRDGTLYVVGTDNDDHVTINQRGNGLLKVHADFFPEANFRTYTAAGIRAIEVLLYGGSDQATVAGNIITPVLLDGGSGNDRLNGGGGPNILLGGIGDDKLIGGAAADILIGGLGSDRLVGNGGDDILVAGSATVDPDPTVPGQRFDQALLSLVTEWNRSKSKGTIRSRLHAMDDGVEDVLTGSAGQDWFFARSQGLARDRILGRGADETVDELG
jgi:Ca2+-binding RTX toxin-like protein